MFCTPGPVFGGTETSGPVVIFCAPGLIFGGIDGVECGFHVLRSRTQFCRYRGRQVLFSCFALSDSFSAVPKALGPVFIFCTPGPVFVSSALVEPRFHVLRSRTYFALGPVIMFCAPGPLFGDTGGVGSLFHVLRYQTHFRRCRGRRVPFSCFALLDSFLAVPRASGPDFMFCAPGSVLGGTEGVGSRFQVLRYRTRFQRYRRPPVLFYVLRSRTRFR
jgi:hypothetical protein